ncbi:MAG: 7-cyano-7-deazaguanine synthase QueC [Candidatus Omnitrophica bacterium]|jgi:7-cyano-7-deazaguanine synthase|nr:7-cyano-7-deazaguanine synthase QueC [Candidatus Omnitrophota bacterium]
MLDDKIKKVKNKAVILLSGGIDSVTTLYLALKKRYRLTALIFDYGQRHKKEINYAKKIAKLNHVKYYLLKGYLPWVNSSLTKKSITVAKNRNLKKKIIPLTYVAGRNIVFLSYAFSLAESIKAQAIFIGAHIQDYSGYPDCRPKFLKKIQIAANAGLKEDKIKVIAPLLNKSKRDIIRIGIRLGVPFEYTWSCYEGAAKPCLKCDSCRFRIQSFKALGLKDPLLV